MICNIYEKDPNLEYIRRKAETLFVGNEAFLGMKGIGKTTLFQFYFMEEKRKELATNYHKLFVMSRLDSRKKGADLYQFLLGVVEKATNDITDEEKKKKIVEKIEQIKEKDSDYDSKLTNCLDVIKE